MGFTVPRRTALITFEGTDYDGAEIECRLDVPISMLFEFSRLGVERDNEALFRRWAEECLLEWNLDDDDGRPLPATADGLMSLPPTMVTSILSHWTEATTGLAGPLGERSPVGAT